MNTFDLWIAFNIRNYKTDCLLEEGAFEKYQNEFKNDDAQKEKLLARKLELQHEFISTIHCLAGQEPGYIDPVYTEISKINHLLYDLEIREDIFFRIKQLAGKIPIEDSKTRLQQYYDIVNLMIFK